MRWSTSEARAREVTDYRARQKRDKAAARQTGMRGSLEQMMAQVKTAGRKEFPLVIKGDVQGSIEAIAGALDKLGTDEVGARMIHSGVGGISESDVTLAESSGAAIIGFNVRAHKEAREAAERTGTEIRYYNIIYNLVDDVKAAMSGLLTPERRETMLGNAQILEIFAVSKVGKIAGCRVTDGKVERGANVRLIRDNVVIHEGKLSPAQALQGRRARGAGRPGMRHGVRGLPGHARRRRDRVLSRGDGAAVALTASWPALVAGHPRPDFVDIQDVDARASGRLRPSSTGMPGHDECNISGSFLMPRHHHRDHAAAGPSQRQLRVGELIRHALAEMLSRGDIHDPTIEGAHDHRARGAHDGRSAARHRLRDAARRHATRRRSSRRSSATRSSCAARSRAAST